jgi:hypothetical protein
MAAADAVEEDLRRYLSEWAWIVAQLERDPAMQAAAFGEWVWWGAGMPENGRSLAYPHKEGSLRP